MGQATDYTKLLLVIQTSTPFYSWLRIDLCCLFFTHPWLIPYLKIIWKFPPFNFIDFLCILFGAAKLNPHLMRHRLKFLIKFLIEIWLIIYESYLFPPLSPLSVHVPCLNRICAYIRRVYKLSSQRVLPHHKSSST